MLIYLLKSTACLALFLAFYKVFLENEQMHLFKRFYLIAIIVLSVSIPAIVFTEYVEIQKPITANIAYSTLPDLDKSTRFTKPNKPFNWTIVAWGFYALGVLVFGTKFLRNIAQIHHRINRNTKVRTPSNTKVLLEKLTVPHTFFHYIFLNKKKYLDRQIPVSVLLHEETHAQQKHSVDVLLVELLQVLFWFNPFIYVLKHCIKLNHEFLADQAVIKEGTHPSDYQKTILHYSSIHQPSLANAINYSSIKKRFTVMKKQTSKKSVLLRSVLLLPLIILLLYGFTETKTVQTLNVKSEVQPFSHESLKSNKNSSSKRTVEIAGLVLDSETLSPIDNVDIYNSKGKVITKTDNNGYYKVLLQIWEPGELFFQFSVNKSGYRPYLQKEHWGNLKGRVTSAMFIGLQRENSDVPELSGMMTNISNLDYTSIFNTFQKVEPNFLFEKKVYLAKKENQDIFFEIDGNFYLVNDSWIQLNSRNDLVAVDNTKILPAFELNNYIDRSEIIRMTPIENRNAVFALFTKEPQETIKTIRININKKGQLLVQDDLVDLSHLKNYLQKINTHLKREEKEKVVRSLIYTDTQTPKEVIKKVDEILTEYGVATIDLVGREFEEFGLDQQGATPRQLKKYNTLAKKYNDMDRNQMSIKKQEVDTLKEIYALMSKKQKADAEPFPDLPEPPPAPERPKAPNTADYSTKVIEEIIEEQDPYDVVGQGIGVNQPPLPEPPSAPTHVKDIDPTSPPPPPTPKSPLQHIEEMAQKGARFIHNGKEISVEKAFEIVKNTDKINVDTRGTSGKRPIVELRTKPVETGN